MRAGALDRSIQIERPVTTIDQHRVETTVWQPFATARAQLLQQPVVQDTTGAGFGHRTDINIGFRIRFIPGVTLDMHVIYEGQTFQIKSIRELGRRLGLDLNVERVGP